MSYETFKTAFGTTIIVRVDDGAMIPEDPRNMDYQAYLAWVAAGNTATEYTPPPIATDGHTG